jgi:hypothetical protein
MPSEAPFKVRVFGYQLSNQRKFAADFVWMHEEPPLWSVIGISNGVEPVILSFPGPGPDNATIIGVEVPEGAAIRWELQPLGPEAKRARIAGEGSRRMGSGFDYLEWSAGSSFAFVDAADLP